MGDLYSICELRTIIIIFNYMMTLYRLMDVLQQLQVLPHFIIWYPIATVSYSNSIRGLELSVVGHVQLVGFKVADNRDNGMEVQETHGVWGGPLIEVIA